jgi:hypothetical protein
VVVPTPSWANTNPAHNSDIAMATASSKTLLLISQTFL